MYAVILAGGGGTRLWPLSRGSRPKPFLPLLDGGRYLLRSTVERLQPLISPDDVYVVTEARYVELVGEVVPAVPARNIVAEPLGRNTAAAVALAAHGIDRSPDDVMVVLPADHAIAGEGAFRAALAAASARAGDGDLVTLGITPDGPATGYGYVVPAGDGRRYAGQDSYRVERFEEKPTPERAAELLAAGAAWNAGIFVWRRDAVSSGLERHAPAISDPIRAWLDSHPGPTGNHEGSWPGASLGDVYAEIPATSIDYALLEPASVEGRVAVVPASMGWSDLGSWSALLDHRSVGHGGTGLDGAGGAGPVVSAEPPARVIEIGGQRVLVHAAGGRTVAVVGLEDVIVVDTPDALLVTSTASAQEVKRVVDLLREEGRQDLL